MLSNLCTIHPRHVAIGQDMSNPVKASSASPRVPGSSAALWEALSLLFCWSPIMVTFASVARGWLSEKKEQKKYDHQAKKKYLKWKMPS